MSNPLHLFSRDKPYVYFGIKFHPNIVRGSPIQSKNFWGLGASHSEILATLPIPDPPEWHEGEVGSHTLYSTQTIFIF